jgi:hypothetical protein
VAELDNPAARILAVLERLQPLLSEQGPARDAWQRAFDIGDPFDLPNRIAHFIQQVQLTKELVAALPDDEDPEHLSTYFNRLDQICNNLLGVGTVNQSEFVGLVKPELLFSLGSCSRAIRRNGGREPTIDIDGIESILNTISEVRNEIVASNMPRDVNIFILRRLREVEDAVFTFKIAGYSGVEDTLDALLGGAAWRTPATQQQPVENWVKRIFLAIQTAARGTAAIAGSTQTVVESYKAITGK